MLYHHYNWHPCQPSHLLSPIESSNLRKQRGNVELLTVAIVLHAPLQRGFQEGKIRWALYAARLSDLQHLTA
jgi:hypothetical protein